MWCVTVVVLVVVAVVVVVVIVVLAEWAERRFVVVGGHPLCRSSAGWGELVVQDRNELVFCPVFLAVLSLLTEW